MTTYDKQVDVKCAKCLQIPTPPFWRAKWFFFMGKWFCSNTCAESWLRGTLK